MWNIEFTFSFLNSWLLMPSVMDLHDEWCGIQYDSKSNTCMIACT